MAEEKIWEFKKLPLISNQKEGTVEMSYMVCWMSFFIY